MNKTLCEICQKVTYTRVISGMEVCCQHVTEKEWDKAITWEEANNELEYTTQ